MLRQKDRYQLVTLLLKIANSINKSRNLHLRKLNLTSRQADILFYVSRHPDCTMTNLAIYMGCAHQTVQEVAKNMVHKRLLTMKKSKRDGRCQVIQLTRAGAKDLSAYSKRGIVTGVELVRGMSNQYQKLLLKLLIQCFNNLDV